MRRAFRLAGRSRPRRVLLARTALAIALAAVAGVSLERARADPPGTALPPPASGGIERLDPLLRKLTNNRRLLVIAAHPDDEDSPLLTVVSRGMGGEAAYLSLSRGDGGQNLIGDELGVGLGLIRTEELNAARRLDGARQYFTRAYDFGFSKSIEETFRFWPKEALLEDTVRIIRRFRPQVVVAIFSGTPRDGHGQHQASGIVAREAFHSAGDANAFPEQAREGLLPWRPTTLYQTTRFLDRDKTTMVLPTGILEPLTGRTFQQIGVASRSLQRSQGTGALQPTGPNEARLGWLEGGAGKDAKDPFDGIDTRLAALGAVAPDAEKRRAAEASLARAEEKAKQIRAALSPERVSAAVEPLASVLEDLRSARALVAPSSPLGSAAAAILDEKIAIAQTALACAAGVAIDALSDVETATAGDAISATVQVFNAGGEALEVEKVTLESAAGWMLPPAAAGKPVAPGTLAEWKLAATLPAGAHPTVPYFLEKPLRGALYDWSGAPQAVRGEPFGPPPLVAVASVKIGRARFAISREVTFRYRDEEYGEVRHPVRAVPRVEVSVSPELVVWSIAGSSAPARTSVTLVSNSKEPVAGRVIARAPDGWSAAPQPFSLAKKGDRVIVDVSLSPPRSARAARFDVPIEAEVASGETCRESVRLIDYEHIRPVPSPAPSALTLTAVDLKLPPLSSVGYVRGASDRVPEALLAIGVPIHLLSSADLERGDLARYDAIVVGARAYETEPALAASNTRLLEYVRSGGLVIVQYQQYGFVQGGFAPEKLEIARPHDRVTDETAPVTVLSPTHPIFTTPNRIGPADWEGWIQERGLYFAHAWGPSFVPLLSMADPGEPEQKGALLAATIGKGDYVYTGLAFFRELPAGVPGAYRLFANLLAWRAPRQVGFGRR